MNTETVAADTAGIARAVALLALGHVVALPTETVYGLAGDATNSAAVAAIYTAKGRPGFNPLIVHVADLAAVERVVEVDDIARALADRFWPGPLTLVLPARPGNGIAPDVTAGLATLAVRVPAHPVMRAVLTAFGRPLAAPSANASGTISPTTAAHVAASLGGRIPLIVDGGATPGGLESAIVRVDGGRVSLLRPGGIDAALLGITAAAGLDIVAPGQLASHYAPTQPLRLDATSAEAGEFLIGFGAVAGDITLSATGNIEEAAAALFAGLHTAQASGAARIAVAPIPDTGVGAAINDRLRRAAAPRG
ncbi:threonylcarbamoyl-AMP synthase [Polymorphobacter sp. PAMC 29334]|uniref:L-threonylcarbamoyladenylate synthase n=1 Tax=Polymorphobacter sp. PAMC 29334 TaxID=2862331 RepID=UPI001C78B998|nr:L-threonylcarbamoyladenylate synthase [Polymorphobacter sp. PAMC 29334]QYE36198.1 threonylcarbamoyl-AMP synthase [Polymorphobacter sp. PAMC 29334]